MARLKGGLRALWACLRELSGEAALERRMRACACSQAAPLPRGEAVKQAWTEAFDQPHRCC